MHGHEEKNHLLHGKTVFNSEKENLRSLATTNGLGVSNPNK